MRHGNGQQRRCYRQPVVHGLVIEIRPVEIVIRIEFAIRAGIGEVSRFLGIHRHKNLHQREQPGKYAFVRVFLNLVARLADGNAASLQLQMKYGHSVNQQHQIAAPVVQHF